MDLADELGQALAEEAYCQMGDLALAEVVHDLMAED